MPLTDRFPMLAPMTDFLRWWIDELAAIARMVRVGKMATAHARIILEPGSVTVERITGTHGERFVENRPFDALDEKGFDEIAALTSGRSTQLCLQRPEIFVTSLDLPRAAGSRLNAAIGLQMGELAPIWPELLVWTVIDRSRDPNGLHLRIAMAKRTRIEAVQERFEAHGLLPPAIHAWDDGQEAAFPNISNRAFQGVNRSKPAIAMALLLGSIPFTVLGGAAILTNIAQGRAAALEDGVRQVRAGQRVAATMEERRRLLAPLYGQPGAAAILNDLADRLPANDWLLSISRRADGRLSLSVATNDEAALDKALHASRLLQRARAIGRSPRTDGIEVDYVADAS